MKKNLMIFSVLIVSLMMISVVSADSVSFGTIGSGATAIELGSGIELHTDDGGLGSGYVRLEIPGGIALENIDSLSYTAKVTNPGVGDFAPEVVLNIDADGTDGLEGTGINWMLSGHSASALDGDNFLSGDENPPTKATADSTFVNIDALSGYSYWAANDARDSLSPTLYSSFSTVVSSKLPIHGIDVTDKVYSIDFVVGTSGNFNGMTAIFSSVELNGKIYDLDDTEGPIITVVHAPVWPNCNEYPTITATVEEENLLFGSVKLKYKYDGYSWDDISFMKNPYESPFVLAVNWIDLTVPEDIDGESFTYYVEAKDTFGNLGASNQHSYIYDCFPPVADAGDDQTIDEGETIDVDGSGSTDSSAMTYEWDWTSDGIYDDTGVTATSPIYDNNGVYTVTLRVTDAALNQHTDTLTVTVNNVAPVVEAGADQTVDEGNLVTIAPTFTDVGVLDTHTATVDWNDGSTLELIIPATSPMSETHTYTNNGVYTVTVTVTDNDGGVDSDTLTITVDDVDPTANAGADQTIVEGQNINVDGSSSTGNPHDLISLYEWDFDYDGSTFNVDTTGATATSPFYTDDGSYVVALRVTDEDSSNIDTFDLTVTDVDPTAEAGADQTIVEGQTINVDGSSSTGNTYDLISLYEWDWTSDGTYDTTGITATSPVYADDGSYTVTLRVTDEDSSNIDTFDLTVTDIDPTAEFSCTPLMGVGTLPIDCTDESDSYDGIVTWEWEVTCDNSNIYISSVQNPSFTISENGICDVSLTVHELDGDSAEELKIDYVTVYDYKIELDPRCNLISIPLVPESTNVLDVLNSVTPDSVWAYKLNPVTGVNEWYYHPSGSVPASVGNLNEMVPGYGYYVCTNKQETIYQNGEKYYEIGQVGIPMPPQVELTTGWNLIGHYGMNNVCQSDEVQDLSGGILTDLADITLLNQYATPMSILEPNFGYWAFITGENNLLYAPSSADYNQDYQTSCIQ